MDKVIRYWDFGTKVLKSTATFATSMIFLEKTVASLGTKKDELIAIREDVKMKVQVEEEHGKMMTKQAEDWMKRVEETEIKVNEVLAEHQDIRNHGLLFRFGSTCMLGPKSTELLNVIQELLSKRKCLELAIQRPRPAPTKETEGFCEIPLGSQKLVGIDSTFEEVLKGLKDDNVGIIGLYGMGGVGKTTLLKIFNNELPKSGDDAFDCALWVLASGNATIETIQQGVSKKLGISSSNKSVDEVRNEIYNKLRSKRYIFMLDDVWRMIDLFEGVGTPKPNNINRSKIIFTTRGKDVCFQMGAHLITEVKCLPWEEAWSLFQEKVGKTTLGPHIESYAIKVAMECSGVPLALITIGRAMSGKVEPREWSHALDQLQNYPAEIPDLGKKVFPKLRLSYDYLADSTKQKCFLYCSLFPEDFQIHKTNLVNLWMGEGYLNKKHDIKKACDYGYSIIEDLKRSCLLESGGDAYDETVKMHDMIRDMALWITEKKFLVVDKAEIMRAKINEQDWTGDVEKMSLWETMYEFEEGNSSEGDEEGNSSEEDQEMLILSQECPNLSTLLVEASTQVNLCGLMNFIPNVRVLSFSWTYGMTKLPKGILKLENLEYLDISDMSIRRLPKEMKSLRKLRHLLMNGVELVECPGEIISSLTELLVFLMSKTPSTEQLLRGLEKLQNIQRINVSLKSPETLDYLQNSEKLRLCTTYIHLNEMHDVEELELSPTKMRNLETLSIDLSDINAIKCINPNKLIDFNCLSVVNVGKCNRLKELDILSYAPSLILLCVSSCRSIERIIKEEEEKAVFLSLKAIRLFDLPSLENICNGPLSFPTLEILEIIDCPKLKQNPFNDMDRTTTKLRRIMGDKTWWDSLMWRDDLLRLHFSPFFNDIPRSSSIRNCCSVPYKPLFY